ncbi:hypothetical protein K7I13_03350 [Brucepastera parasyntrophica]|uniref:hypothetical protein n=1 Tax=Brucepastera parasyntrophica TaxID=2880008 RepID=UPI00210D7E83|nr:hypothetical protein [Brucepastera parasyntrophica]ULQ60358.1 hypothetical protein K7I13_03350 [Brucepastera parasyntrophica]
MDRTAADAFVYSKASGMYARSFVGIRARKLFEAKRIQDLWALLFSEEVPLVPEGLLALLLERKAEQTSADDYIRLLSAYDKPDALSRALILLFDYNNLKAAADAVLLGATTSPFMVNIGNFGLFNQKKWPNIAAMTQNTPVSWYNRIPSFEEQIEWENRLDEEYYETLWHSMHSLRKKTGTPLNPLSGKKLFCRILFGHYA